MVIAILGGCASNPSNGPVYDPYENTNRKIFKFNDALDRNVLVPVAKGYRRITPDPLENGIGNFFNNLDDVNVIANDILQGKLKQAGQDTGRFLVNSTVGLLGFIDIGTRIGLVKHNESFGQTLGVWGIGEGPFLMLPLFGPNNARSTTGIVVENVTTDVPNLVLDDNAVILGLGALEIVSLRARLLTAGNLFNAAALDPYLLLRDFWVQRHRRATCDGTCDVRLNTLDDGSDDLDELDELDELDRQDQSDELDELDELDEMDRLDALDQSDNLDELDELDRMDALDQQNPPDELDEMDELDRLDALDAPVNN